METATHEATQITANSNLWRTFGATVFTNGGVRLDSDELLWLGIAATGSRDERAVLWAMAERTRRSEERTRVTAEARLADSLQALAHALGTESVEALVKRLPDRLRPYLETVLRNKD